LAFQKQVPPLVTIWRAEQSAVCFFSQKELVMLLISGKQVRGLFQVQLNALGCYARSLWLSSKFHYKVCYELGQLQFAVVASTTPGSFSDRFADANRTFL